MRVDLPLRACLGKGSGEKQALPTGAWSTIVSEQISLDLNKEEDIGEAAFETVLRAIDSLAGSGYPATHARLTVGVQCGPSVTSSHEAGVQNLFSPGKYLGITVIDSVRLRIQLNKSLELPARVVTPAMEFKSKLLNVFQISDSATSQELDKAIKKVVTLILTKAANDEITAKSDERNLEWLGEVIPFSWRIFGSRMPSK